MNFHIIPKINSQINLSLKLVELNESNEDNENKITKSNSLIYHFNHIEKQVNVFSSKYNILILA